MTKTTAIAPFAKGSNTRVRWIPEMSGALRANFDRLVRDLDLKKRARREAVENRPATTDDDLDVAQREALAAVDAGGNMLRQTLDARLAEAADLVQARTPKALDGAAEVARARLDLDHAELARTESFVELWKEHQRALRQKLHFQREHGLVREPMYTDDFYKAWALLLWLWLAESGLNAVAFSWAGGGLIIGFLTAGLFAIANLLLGMATGWFGLRRVWHSRPAVRVLGVVASATGLAAGLGLNVVVAQYREALREHASNEIAEAFNRSASLGGFSDLSPMSICLLVLGLVFFGLALTKGVGGEHAPHDPYVGYKEHARPWRRASHALSAAKTACLADMKAAVAQVESRLRAQMDEDARLVREARDIGEQAMQRAGEIADSIAEWRDIAAMLLQTYRDENCAVRTDPPPAYFAVFPDLRAMLRGLPDGAAVSQLAERAREIHEANLLVTRELHRELSEILGQRLRGFNDFIAKVEKRGLDELEGEGAANASPAQLGGGALAARRLTTADQGVL